MTGKGSNVFETAALEKVARSTNCSGIGCADSVDVDHVNSVWTLSFDDRNANMITCPLTCCRSSPAISLATGGIGLSSGH